MLCDELKDRIYEYIYEELTVEKKLEVEEHLLKCNSCKKEYEELKTLLIDDMESLIELKDEIQMPEVLQINIKKKLYLSSKNSFTKYVAAACLLIFMFYTIPVAAYYLVENTILNKYINFDKGLVMDVEQGRVQLVDKSATMKEITFRVDGIIRKEDKTTILYTVKLPKGSSYAMSTSGFGTIRIKDQFGISYRQKGSATTVESIREDGEATAIMDIEPLKFWAYKLTINITAMETGQLVSRDNSKDNLSAEDKNQFPYTMVPGRNIYGSWKVDFYIDRAHRNK